MAHSSRGLGHRPLKAEITGSNPVCAPEVTFRHASSRFNPGSGRSHFWTNTRLYSNCTATPKERHLTTYPSFPISPTSRLVKRVFNLLTASCCILGKTCE